MLKLISNPADPGQLHAGRQSRFVNAFDRGWGGTGNALPVLRSNKRCLDIFSIQDKRVRVAVGIIIGVGVGIGIGIEG
jgi:hypothetical protein